MFLLSPPDLAHSAFADHLDQPIRPDLAAMRFVLRDQRIGDPL